MVKVKMQKNPALSSAWTQSLYTNNSQANDLSVDAIGASQRYRHECQDVQAEQSGPKIKDDEELPVNLVD
jgi:hypothetical protein